jgi:ribosomal protein S18 acetylase RimI-like enzyme
MAFNADPTFLASGDVLTVEQPDDVIRLNAELAQTIAEVNAQPDLVNAYGTIRPFEDDFASGLDELFSAPNGRTWRTDLTRLVALGSEGQIVGHVAWGTPHPQVVQTLVNANRDSAPADDELLEIQELLVTESHRRRGLGSKLLNASIDAIRAVGRSPVLACQMDNSAALGLYLSEGFVVGGRFVLSRAGGFYSMIQDVKNG